MYKAKLWDEEKDIHSGSYTSSKYINISSDGKKDDVKYHEQKYGSRVKNLSSDYTRREDEKGRDGNETSNIFDNLEEEKNEKQDLKEDEVPFKAAKQIFDERELAPRKIEESDNTKTIEDAIKKAIREEKNVIIIDS